MSLTAKGVSTALRRAEDFGVDVTLLVANLERSPTERVRRAQQALESAMALRSAAAAWRERSSPRT